MSETQTPLENVNEPNHGSYPWNERITNDIFADERREFREWLFEYGVEDNIVSLLHEQGFLTEGDMSLSLGFESSPNNPFHFFCGDVHTYFSVLSGILSRRREQIDKFDSQKDPPALLNFLLEQASLIQEALDEQPILPEEKNDKD